MIRIQGHDYTVSFDDKMGRRQNLSGVCNVHEGYILLDPNESTSQQKGTLIHEFVESVNAEFALGLEHSQIVALGTGLYQIIADNPKIFTMALPEGDE